MLKVKRSYDIEGNYNRGWQVDMLELLTEDGKSIGYMKLGYIPFDRFKEHYPHIIYYMDRMKGWCGLIDLYKNKNWERLAKKISAHDRSIGYNEYTYRTQKNTHEEWEVIGKNAVKQLERKYISEFSEFELYYVDKYYVDFVRIHEDHRGNGYYLKFYQEALKWVEEQNMPLFTNSQKSDIAQRRFNKYLKQHKIIGHHEYYERDDDKERFKIDKVIYE